MELDPVSRKSVERAGKKSGQAVAVLANEPSLGLYRVCEHLAKTTPPLLDTVGKMDGAGAGAASAGDAMMYAQDAIDSIAASESVFDSIARLVEHATHAAASSSAAHKAAKKATGSTPRIPMPDAPYVPTFERDPKPM